MEKNKITRKGVTFMFVVSSWSKPRIYYVKEFKSLRFCLGFIFINIGFFDFTNWYNLLLKEIKK